MGQWKTAKMKDLHFILGLPRTGSTTLTALLDQNPDFYATGTSPLPSIIEMMVKTMGPQSDFHIIEHKLLKKQFYGMMKGCIQGWHEAETEKPVVFSKSRPWILFYDELKNLYPDAKFIFCVRDLRGIILSFEKLMPEFPFLRFPVKEAEDIPLHRLTVEQRINYWLYHEMSALGLIQKHFLKFYQDYDKNPDDFFIFKYEEFGPNPDAVMKKLYNFLGYKYWEHNYENINHTPKEYDTPFWSYVDHTVGKKIVYKEPDYSMFAKYNEKILDENSEFYKRFYPEIFEPEPKRRRF